MERERDGTERAGGSPRVVSEEILAAGPGEGAAAHGQGDGRAGGTCGSAAESVYGAADESPARAVEELRSEDVDLGWTHPRSTHAGRRSSEGDGLPVGNANAAKDPPRHSRAG